MYSKLYLELATEQTDTMFVKCPRKCAVTVILRASVCNIKTQSQPGTTVSVRAWSVNCKLIYVNPECLQPAVKLGLCSRERNTKQMMNYY